ncbi:MAG TPA: M18 family aminopeptidase [Rhodocyclaceae bacterium]|nr:M18 family aminopeptidase [Betaproteobacteria bacterium]HMV00415.1 M18 family aminopeptidase [Rhodocyclaceae bacterium]HMV20443.1 M18 family aminopeptidase [Rhodocyclaceae bacterium]HNL21528.1 M18 family aminopeptidase [Rhodocyclaceae bacterium]HNM22237.1 M18 family aminopeptidase [Rhodocyclaceae bacterium]
MSIDHALAADLLAFLDASPSPWHAVAVTTTRLAAAGFASLDEGERWSLQPGGRYYVVRGGSSLIAFSLGGASPDRSGWRLVGAHTDSPGLRIKPQPVLAGDSALRLAVEVYGGPILATFADRDLSLAGRVVVGTAGGPETRLLAFGRPLVRLPNLAIHMNREVNEQGLKFNRQSELPLLLAVGGIADGEGQFRRLLADTLGVEPESLLAWDLAAHDTQPAAFWGADREFVASGRLDNLASCHAALSALLATETSDATAVVALFDHEEVGSESAVGAGGSFVGDVLARLAAALGVDAEGERCARARSFFVSADMAHAWNPNYPAAYEPGHRVLVNGGPAIKINASQRYATGADTAARFARLCADAGVPCQRYVHRSDLGCGSTIGPQVAARLGVPTVDVGNPMWAMHSLRESAGVLDQAAMVKVLREHFRQ